MFLRNLAKTKSTPDRTFKKKSMRVSMCLEVTDSLGPGGDLKLRKKVVGVVVLLLVVEVVWVVVAA